MQLPITYYPLPDDLPHTLNTFVNQFDRLICHVATGSGQGWPGIFAGIAIENVPASLLTTLLIVSNN